jgi:hypothetical protein
MIVILIILKNNVYNLKIANNTFANVKTIVLTILQGFLY